MRCLVRRPAVTPRLGPLLGPLLAPLSPCVLALGAALLLAGPAQAQAPDPANPRVLVTNGQISVDQDTIRFSKKKGKVKITWRLPAQGNYAFPTDGIVIERQVKGGRDPKLEFTCARAQNPRLFSCENRNTVPGTYKYTVKVDENGQPLPPLDPIIINEF